MKESKLCPKCSSDKVAYPLETRGYPGDPIKVAVAPKHSILGISIPATFDLQAAVCGHCGYIELYVTDPSTVYEKWSDSHQ